MFLIIFEKMNFHFKLKFFFRMKVYLNEMKNIIIIISKRINFKIFVFYFYSYLTFLKSLSYLIFYKNILNNHLLKKENIII